MSEEKENNPLLDFKDLAISETIKIKLDCTKPVVTGEGKYGEWNLWFALVENARVYRGRGSDRTAEENYTGKVIFFPSEKLNEQLVKLADGNINVGVSVTKEVEEGRKGLIRRYVARKLSEGTPSSSNLTPTETKLVDDVKDVANSGIKFTEELFIKASQDDVYEGKIPKERAIELFKKYLN